MFENNHFFELHSAVFSSGAYVGDGCERIVKFYGNLMVPDGMSPRGEKREGVEVTVECGDRPEAARNFGVLFGAGYAAEEERKLYADLSVPPEIFDDAVRLAQAIMAGIEGMDTVLTVEHEECLDVDEMSRSRTIKLDGIRFHQGIDVTKLSLPKAANS